MANCSHCNDTGKRPGSIDLDCSCPAATARIDLKDAVEEFSFHYDRDRQFYPDDRDWFIHQRALQIERQEQAARIAELERALRSAHHLLANVEGMSKNNIENMAGEEADAIASVLAAAPSAPAVEQQLFKAESIDSQEFRKLADAYHCVNEQDEVEPTYYAMVYFIDAEIERQVKAALAAPQAADTDKVREVPEGWKLVPIEPTREMQECMDKGSAYNTWKNMLDAAPLPSAPVQQEGAIPASNKEQA